MVEGESGILACAPPWNRPVYQSSKRTIRWPNGATAKTFSADRFDRLRGPQHTAAWVDELCAFRYPDDAWNQLQFGLRLGPRPRVIVTTTPRPIPLLRSLLADPTTHVTRGSTYDNASNLAKTFLAQLLRKYEGTRLGRQELRAELLTDTPGALWTHGLIEAQRVATAPELTRIVVAIDPAVSATEGSDETGIVVVGIDAQRHGYVLEDASGVYSADAWARLAVSLYDRWKADRVVAEVNNGGDLVEAVIRSVDPNVSYTAVHASRGKVIRAEPVSALYEQGRVSHVGGLAKLEDQMCTWSAGTGEKSPDRVDALVWGVTELMLGEVAAPYDPIRIPRRR